MGEVLNACSGSVRQIRHSYAANHTIGLGITVSADQVQPDESDQVVLSTTVRSSGHPLGYAVAALLLIAVLGVAVLGCGVQDDAGLHRSERLSGAVSSRDGERVLRIPTYTPAEVGVIDPPLLGQAFIRVPRDWARYAEEGLEEYVLLVETIVRDPRPSGDSRIALGCDVQVAVFSTVVRRSTAGALDPSDPRRLDELARGASFIPAPERRSPPDSLRLLIRETVSASNGEPRRLAVFLSPREEAAGSPDARPGAVGAVAMALPRLTGRRQDGKSRSSVGIVAQGGPVGRACAPEQLSSLQDHTARFIARMLRGYRFVPRD